MRLVLLKLKFPVLCFVDHILFFCLFSVDHCVVCPCSIYWFWLPLWCLQTLLANPMVSDERGKEDVMVATTNGTYIWSCDTDMPSWLNRWRWQLWNVRSKEFNFFIRNSWLRNVFVTSNSLSRITVLTVTLTQLTWYLCSWTRNIACNDWFDFWCLTPLSVIFQLYHGDHF